MTKEQVIRIFKNAGYEDVTSGYIQTPHIRAIILPSNQGINFREDFIKLENDLLKIKNYNYKVVSGRLSSNIKIDNNLIINNNTGNIYLRHNVFQFRAPKVGDFVFISNNNGDMLSDMIKITRCGGSFIELETSIPVPKDNEFIIYIDGSMAKNSVKDLVYTSLYFNYEPKTDLPVDIYLDVNQILGFELHTPILGSV